MNRIITDHTKWVKAAAVIACCLALAILSLAASAVHAQGPSYNPYLIQGIVDQTTTGTGSTLLPVEFGGTGYVRFDVGNTGFDDLTLAQDDEMTLVVTLSKGVPDAANPLDALSGPGVAWFSWQYDPAIKTYYATQIATIPGDSRANITIAYKVTQNSFLGASPTVSNGFNVNLQPPGYTNPQPTDDDAVSSYTYVQAKDYGDAPVTGTAPNGIDTISYGSATAEINLVKDASNFYEKYMYLGASVDPETVNQPSVGANGDDLNQSNVLAPSDDENGVTFPVLRQGATVIIPVVVTMIDADQTFPIGVLNAWIDWNGDGDWNDPGEKIASSISVFDSGIVNLTVTVPVDAITTAPTYARFRFGANANTISSASFGEVEDYQIQILVPTAVNLAGFEAEALEDRIVVTWETASEFNNAGFNLYRALEIDGEQTLLNWFPSPAPGTTQGQMYKYRDYDVLAGQTYWYWLEDVDLNGVATRHGPVSTTFGPVQMRKFFLPMLLVR